MSCPDITAFYAIASRSKSVRQKVIAQSERNTLSNDIVLLKMELSLRQLIRSSPKTAHNFVCDNCHSRIESKIKLQVSQVFVDFNIVLNTLSNDMNGKVMLVFGRKIRCRLFLFLVSL